MFRAKQLVLLLPLLYGLTFIVDAAENWPSPREYLRRRTTLFNEETRQTEHEYDHEPDSTQDELETLYKEETYGYQHPHLTLNKPVYNENEAITISFSVGSPNDPFYKSSLAPTQEVDFNYPEWTVGLFMRDADPQGGKLKPIVSIKLCGQYECDPGIVSYSAYSSSVTFDGEGDFADAMYGKWPLLVGTYGTGFDAFLLDGRGAAALGPVEFNIRGVDGEDFDVPLPEQSPYSLTEFSGSYSSRSSNHSSTYTNEGKAGADVKKDYGLLAHNHAATKKAAPKLPTTSTVIVANELDENAEDNE
ncbi:hypothetical protein ACHAXS_001712 [Conticribra weissflogii]